MRMIIFIGNFSVYQEPLRSKHYSSRLNIHSRSNTLYTSTLPYQHISEYAKATSSPKMANSSIAFLWKGATCFELNRESGYFNFFHSLSGHSQIKKRVKSIMSFGRTGIQFGLFLHFLKSLDAISFSIHPLSIGSFLRVLKG